MKNAAATAIGQFLASLPLEICDYVIETPLGLTLSHPFLRLPSLEATVAAKLVTPEEVIQEISKASLDYEKLSIVGNFVTALNKVDRAYRAEYLWSLIELHDTINLYEAIGAVWTGVENIFRDWDIWNDIWSAVIECEGDMRAVMQIDDRIIFNQLPEFIKIYRGFREEGGEYGWSWTLDRDKAEWFARRYNASPKLGIVTVPKKATLAYFGGRGEAEIVVHPDQFDDILVEKLELAAKAA